MSSRVIKFIIIFFIASCNFNHRTNDGINRIKEISVNIIGLEKYEKLISMMNDSIKIWKLNKLQKYIEVKGESEYIADSLICLNREGNRFITCLIEKVLVKPNPTGGITFFYGERINNKWYFFPGDHIFIPHEMKDIRDGNPFTYQQLHQIALKEVYGGYLKSNGEINEHWFVSHFEDSGWGNFDKQESSLKYLGTKEKFTDKKKFFEAIHLQGVKNLWLQRDTTQPVKELP